MKDLNYEIYKQRKYTVDNLRYKLWSSIDDEYTKPIYAVDNYCILYAVNELYTSKRFNVNSMIFTLLCSLHP